MLLGASSMPRSKPPQSQSGTWCKDSDGVATNQIRWLRGMAVATSTRDTSFRSKLHLMALDSSMVNYVTDSIACRRAAESLRREQYGVDTGALTSLYLVRYGPTRFFGADGAKIGEWMGWTVFDSAFAPLAQVGH